MFNQYDPRSLRIHFLYHSSANTVLQISRDVYKEVHTSRIPRSRSEQGRVRVPRPLRREVLRSER